MRCDNQFCIYWDSGLCLLTAISLDAQGSCRDCIEITLPECILKAVRSASRRAVEKGESLW